MQREEDQDLSLQEQHKHKDVTGRYVWEKKYSGTYQILLEESERVSKRRERLEQQQRKRKRVAEMDQQSHVKKGIVRFLYVIVDMSKNLMKKDRVSSGIEVKMKYRSALLLDALKDFVREFFDQNPLATLGVIATQEGRADLISLATDNPESIHEKLNQYFQEKLPKGLPSLQNALDLARLSLKGSPKYGSKEVLLVHSTLYTTCDPGDIYTTFDALKKENINCSAICFGGEMFVLKRLTEITGGQYVVPIDFRDFSGKLHHFSMPVMSSKKRKIFSDMIEMGFPVKRAKTYTSICACHKKISAGGFICPRCSSKYCQIPTKCNVCRLMLVSSSHLARSFHHLFPVEKFYETNIPDISIEDDSVHDQFNDTPPIFCSGCQQLIPKVFNFHTECPGCKEIFCVDCDAFIHETLHNCPSAKPHKSNEM